MSAGRPLSGRRALVTGGGGGLGSAIASALAADGAEVLVADRDRDAAERVARSLRDGQGRGDGAAQAVALDVTREESWREALTGPARGRVDILVNAAGVIARDSIDSVTEDSWAAVMAVNVLGATLGIKACAPGMKEAGAGVVVTLGSTAALQAHGDPVYCASKWAVRGLSKSAAVELAPWGIRVSCVHPGLIPTELTSTASGGYVDAAVRASPLGRLADAEAVAHAVSYLVSDRAEALTGIDLEVDAGYTVGGAAWARAQARRAAVSTP